VRIRGQKPRGCEDYDRVPRIAHTPEAKVGELEVRFVEIKSPTDSVTTDQELMHAVSHSQGREVEIEPASKTPKCSILPFDIMLKMLEVLEEKQRVSNQGSEQFWPSRIERHNNNPRTTRWQQSCFGLKTFESREFTGRCELLREASAVWVH